MYTKTLTRISLLSPCHAFSKVNKFLFTCANWVWSMSFSQISWFIVKARLRVFLVRLWWLWYTDCCRIIKNRQPGIYQWRYPWENWWKVSSMWFSLSMVSWVSEIKNHGFQWFSYLSHLQFTAKIYNFKIEL